MRESIEKMSNGFVMPGWEPERLEKLKALFDAYKDVDSEKLFNNLVYFLEAIGPVCEKYDIHNGYSSGWSRMAYFQDFQECRNKETVSVIKGSRQPYNSLTHVQFLGSILKMISVDYPYGPKGKIKNCP